MICNSLFLQQNRYSLVIYIDNAKRLLSKNVKSVREKLGISQLKLAEMANISVSYLAGIEAGNKFPSSKILDRLSDGLGLEIHQLFLSEGSPEWSRVKSITAFSNDLQKGIQKQILELTKFHLRSSK